MTQQTMTKEQILEMHFGSEFYRLKEEGFETHIYNAMEEYKEQEVAKEREENRHLYEQVAMLLSHSGTTNILDAIEKWREERERLSEIMGKEPVTFFLNNILRNLPSEKLPALINALNERCSLPTKEREKSKKLVEAAKCVMKSWNERMNNEFEVEMDGSISGMKYWSPSASMVASSEINKLRQSLTEYEKL